MNKLVLTDLLDDYYDMVYGVIWNMVFDKQDVEDLVQRVWVRVAENVDKFYNMGSEKAKNYMRVIAKNVVIDYFREHEKESEQYNIDDYIDSLKLDDNVFDECFDDGFSENFDLILEKLTEAEKNLIYLKYKEELKNPEIAKLLGDSESNIRVKLCRIRKHIKVILSEEEDEKDEGR